MVKQKRRYYLIENCNGNFYPYGKVREAIRTKVEELYGDYGIGTVEFCGHPEINCPGGMHIFGVVAHSEKIMDVVIQFVKSVDSQPVLFRILKKSSTIRSLYIFAWEEHNRRLYTAAAGGLLVF